MTHLYRHHKTISFDSVPNSDFVAVAYANRCDYNLYMRRQVRAMLRSYRNRQTPITNFLALVVAQRLYGVNTWGATAGDRNTETQRLRQK